MVTVSDANGCIVDSSYIIIDPDPVPVSAVDTGTDVSCFGLCDGSFDTDNLGGPFGGPWDFFTLNYAVDLWALCAGEYVDVLTAYDFGGCPTVFTIIINSPEPLDGDAYINPSSCANTCDGSVELEIFGGTPPYSSTFYPDLCEGLYSIFVIDVAGCLLQFDVFVPSLQGGPLIDDIVINSATNGQADGSLTIIASGACPPFSYSINNGPFQASNIFNGLPAGVYLVSVKDGCGCIVETEVIITNLTSVNELKANFSLYPNPVDAYLCVESDQPCSIELVDINGQMIRQADKAKSHSLSVEDIIPGLYLIRISDGAGAAYRRVIVQ